MRLYSPFLIAVAALPAQAQDWQFSPEIAAGVELDDNAQLSVRTDNIVDLRGLLLEASADVRYESETTDFSFTPLILDRSYSDDPEFDSTEIDGRLRYKFESLKSRWILVGRYNSDTVRNAERAGTDLDVTDPDDIPDDDTAITAIRGDRERLTLRPSWTYKWSNLDSVRFSVNYRDVSYEDVLLFLVDYTDTTFSADYRRELSRRTSIYVDGSLRSYETDDRAVKFDTTGLFVGLDTQITEKLLFRARAGAEDIELKNSNLGATRPVGEITFIRLLETTRLLAQYRRTINSSGVGVLTERDALNLNLTRQHSERFESGIGVRAYTESPLDLTGRGDTFGRDYLQLAARFTWNITRNFAFETAYRYTVLRREILGETANSNQIFAYLIYRPKGRDDRR
jgi:hypothetical protein